MKEDKVKEEEGDGIQRFNLIVLLDDNVLSSWHLYENFAFVSEDDEEVTYKNLSGFLLTFGKEQVIHIEESKDKVRDIVFIKYNVDTFLFEEDGQHYLSYSNIELIEEFEEYILFRKPNGDIFFLDREKIASMEICEDE